MNPTRLYGRNHEDRQWDARFNVPTDEYLETLLGNIRSECDKGRFKYVLVGGVEIGTKPSQDDYQCKHVHVAIITHNRISKSSILKSFGIVEGHGYYLVPRNRNLPYSGWRDHHTKPFSKINADKAVLYEYGTLPASAVEKAIKTSEEEKKRKLDDILLEIRDDLEHGRDQESFRKFPRNYLMYGEKIKSMIDQKRDALKQPEKPGPHIWLYGLPGSGKTQVLSFIYPDYYKKNLDNKFFDLYNPKVHGHVMLEDLDHEAVERLSINFIKTLCDEAGFAVDQKYKTPQLSKTCVLVTSNFTIPEIIPEGKNGVSKGIEQNKAALLRRFWHIRIDALLRLLHLKLLPKYDLKKLEAEGNIDSSRLFITYDYLQDRPMCTPLREPSHYQDVIRSTYYGLCE